jgi:hydrogenase expression/formation protein HypE
VSRDDEASGAALECGVPHPIGERVLLGHGGGGRLMHQLLEGVVGKALASDALDMDRDAAVLDVGELRLALTTDSFVVRPRFFPGGDIGSLAVHGTVNDLAMVGAKPAWLTCSLILEEGLATEELERVLTSLHTAARDAGVEVVTGDTKVVERGKGDGIFINTAGVGVVASGCELSPGRVEEGDVILVSGDLGRHGVAVMAARAELGIDLQVRSDSAPLHRVVADLLDAGLGLRCLRDLTRGGLAAALVEVSRASGRRLSVADADIPVSDGVRGACELLGLEPVHLANEGRMVAFVAAPDAERALAIMRRHEVAAEAARIGEVRSGAAGVSRTSAIGVDRVLDVLSGEQLPRIC